MEYSRIKNWAGVFGSKINILELLAKVNTFLIIMCVLLTIWSVPVETVVSDIVIDINYKSIFGSDEQAYALVNPFVFKVEYKYHSGDDYKLHSYSSVKKIHITFFENAVYKITFQKPTASLGTLKNHSLTGAQILTWSDIDNVVTYEFVTGTNTTYLDSNSVLLSIWG